MLITAIQYISIFICFLRLHTICYFTHNSMYLWLHSHGYTCKQACYFSADQRFSFFLASSDSQFHPFLSWFFLEFEFPAVFSMTCSHLCARADSTHGSLLVLLLWVWLWTNIKSTLGLTLEALNFFMKTLVAKGFFLIRNHHNCLS